MPQMSPMLWIMMSPLTLLSLTMLLSNIYFSTKSLPLMNNIIKNNTKNLFYKW